MASECFSHLCFSECSTDFAFSLFHSGFQLMDWQNWPLTFLHGAGPFPVRPSALSLADRGSNPPGCSLPACLPAARKQWEKLLQNLNYYLLNIISLCFCFIKN